VAALDICHTVLLVTLLAFMLIVMMVLRNFALFQLLALMQGWFRLTIARSLLDLLRNRLRDFLKCRVVRLWLWDDILLHWIHGLLVLGGVLNYLVRRGLLLDVWLLLNMVSLGDVISHLWCHRHVLLLWRLLHDWL